MVSNEIVCQCCGKVLVPLYPGSVKCRKPKMKDTSGRTWDCCKIFALDGTEHEGFLDTSYGHWFYFKDGDQWRKAKIDVYMSGLENVADFRKKNQSMKTVYLLYDGRAREGDTERAAVLDYASSEKEVRESRKVMDEHYPDSIWYSYQDRNGKLVNRKMRPDLSPKLKRPRKV